jgi:vacuolar-type H+-ATPase subunit C/Vma6
MSDKKTEEMQKALDLMEVAEGFINTSWGTDLLETKEEEVNAKKVTAVQEVLEHTR